MVQESFFLLIVVSFSGGNLDTLSKSRYIRSLALLAKTQVSGRAKQILEVTDTGVIQFAMFVLFAQASPVPIYDAWEHLFYYAADLDHVDSALPRYEHEIPPGSFAVVAYTMSTYKKGVDFHLNTNVQFVVLVKDFV